METEKEFSFGGIQSPPDYRYVNLENIAGAAPDLDTFPKKFHLLGYSDVPYLDQASIGACTCHSKAEICDHRSMRINGVVKNFSPRFLYALCKIEDGIPAGEGDVGTYCVQGFKVAVKYGVATQETCPNESTLPFMEYIYNRDVRQIPEAAFSEADRNRIIPGYVKVGKTGYVQEVDIKHGLVNGKDGISLCLPVGSEWWTSEAGVRSYQAKDIIPVRKMVTQISGHDTTVTGWETEEGTGRMKVYFRNHWGTRWASGQEGANDYEKPGNGWFYFDQHTFIEAWMPSEIPDALLSIVRSLPKQETFSHEWNYDLKYGDQSLDVEALQIALKIEGMFPFNQPTTLYFGDITRKAVMDFQTKFNITTSAEILAAKGRLGPKTRAALNNIFNHK